MSAKGAAHALIQRSLLPVIFLLSLLVIGIGFSAFDTPAQPKQPDSNDISPFAVDDSLPMSDIVTSDGAKAVLAELLPAKAVVTFWSATCDQCNQLLKDQQELLGPSTLPVLLINIQDTSADGQKKLNELGVKFPSYYDQNGTTFRAWEGTIPASYYIDHGRIKYFFPGRMSRQYIQTLLTLQ